MALGNVGDVVSFAGATKYGVVIKKTGTSSNTVATDFGGKINELQWATETVTTAVVVLQGGIE